jgi:hypothetical protein
MLYDQLLSMPCCPKQFFGLSDGSALVSLCGKENMQQDGELHTHAQGWVCMSFVEVSIGEVWIE